MQMSVFIMCIKLLVDFGFNFVNYFCFQSFETLQLNAVRKTLFINIVKLISFTSKYYHRRHRRPFVFVCVNTRSHAPRV